jgi:hypothetical protein
VHGSHVNIYKRKDLLNAFVLHFRFSFDFLQGSENLGGKSVKSFCNILLVANHKFANQVRASLTVLLVDQALYNPISHLLVVDRNTDQNWLDNILLLTDES